MESQIGSSSFSESEKKSPPPVVEDTNKLSGFKEHRSRGWDVSRAHLATIGTL